MQIILAPTAPGLTEAMQLLKKGERAVLWVPPSIGYKGQPQGTPQTLVYDVEIIDIKPAPAVPADVAKPPANAETTENGVYYKLLQPGTRDAQAKPTDTVTV